jgi:nicotinate-nucleotide adenylyltransferase
VGLTEEASHRTVGVPDGSPALTSKTASADRRIGVFGGAFDPPHQAHVALARAALAQFELDELQVFPTGHAWHKARALSAPEHRLAMTRLAFQAESRVMVDDGELNRAGPTFTIDTLEALQTRNPAARLYLFMGDDQFSAFQRWHRWQDIIDIAIICIAARAHSDWAKDRFDAYPGRFDRFAVLEMPLWPVSATQIRQLIASRAISDSELAQLVSEPVARYISLHRLYGAR